MTQSVIVCVCEIANFIEYSVLSLFEYVMLGILALFLRIASPAYRSAPRLSSIGKGVAGHNIGKCRVIPFPVRRARP
jgi:hypothetical protein